MHFEIHRHPASEEGYQAWVLAAHEGELCLPHTWEAPRLGSQDPWDLEIIWFFPPSVCPCRATHQIKGPQACLDLVEDRWGGGRSLGRNGLGTHCTLHTHSQSQHSSILRYQDSSARRQPGGGPGYIFAARAPRPHSALLWRNGGE